MQFIITYKENRAFKDNGDYIDDHWETKQTNIFNYKDDVVHFLADLLVNDRCCYNDSNHQYSNAEYYGNTVPHVRDINIYELQTFNNVEPCFAEAVFIIKNRKVKQCVELEGKIEKIKIDIERLV